MTAARWRARLAVLGAALLVSLTGCADGSEGGGAGELPTITLAVPTGSPIANVAFIPVGVERGTFRDHGVNLQVHYLQGGTAVASAVQAGQADLALTSPEPLVLAAKQGGDLISVYQVTDQSIYDLGFVPGSRVQELRDLAGARIGVVSPGNIPTYQAYLNHELAKAGLPPLEQSNFVATGEGASATAAVLSKKVDVLLLTDTGLETVKAGVPGLKVVKLSTLTTGFPGLALMARRSVVGEKAGALRSTLAAFAEATKYCVANGQACIDTFARVSPGSVPDLGLANAQWAVRAPLYGSPVDGQHGKNSRDAWRLVETLQANAGVVQSVPEVSTLFTNDLL